MLHCNIVVPTSESAFVGNITKHTAAELVSPSRCVHTLSQEDHTSVLSLAASEKYLFSGSQGAHIAVCILFLMERR
jgi:di- and tripeptidase